MRAFATNSPVSEMRSEKMFVFFVLLPKEKQHANFLIGILPIDIRKSEAINFKYRWFHASVHLSNDPNRFNAGEDHCLWFLFLKTL